MPAHIASMTCVSCGTEQPVDSVLREVQIEMQGPVPLLVVSFRCDLCKHAWTVAHEPIRPPDWNCE